MKYWKKLGFIIFILLIISTKSTSNCFGEATIFSHASVIEVTIDGKWTSSNEWIDAIKFDLKKRFYDNSSKRFFSGTTLGHFLIKDDKEFLYVMIDYVADKNIEDYDSARLRLDIDNDKTYAPQFDDYMIELIWEKNSVKKTIWQGDGTDWTPSRKNLEGLKASSTNDAEGDPYSDSPHLIYEFAIPRDIFEFKSEIGFSASALDYSRTLAKSYEGNGRDVIDFRFISIPSFSNYKRPYTWIDLSFATPYEKLSSISTPTTTPLPESSPIVTPTLSPIPTLFPTTPEEAPTTSDSLITSVPSRPPSVIIVIATIVIILAIILVYSLYRGKKFF